MAAAAGERAGVAAGTAGALRLAVAVRPADALGFRLAGAPVEAVGPGEEAAAFRRLLGDAEVGVLAVEEELLRAVPERLLARVRERGLPVVLPFALPRRLGEEGRGRAYVAALIRRAVGYGVKLGSAGGGGAP
ncbi:V-type ATP synthase subunit F [Anaeromyxobacter sp. PSR-1]|uniref:V-type ATP synthase subunit F n=1 Tax=unclassified Anaeromyxobacter TaxID=2620896 RepID=UPI0005E950C2|nr:V-type ATP synthase subunit F [Anaeromyxobacter sp. PSR-1]GAO04355.1 V-type ATP synthase subunit F [Anaeromyxobacter sp. PSR-1]